LNEFLPEGTLKFKSTDIRMEFTQANDSTLAYIFAYSTDGKEMKVLQVKNGAWEELSYFPNEVTAN